MVKKQVNKIIKYQTSDAREFDDQKVAIQWETQLELAKILGIDVDVLNLMNITEMIVKNKDVIIDLLKDL